MEPFDFHLDVTGDADRGYRVRARNADGGEANTTMRLPIGSHELQHRLRSIAWAVLASSVAVRRAVSSEERPVQELGRALFDAVMTGSAGGLFVASQQTAARNGRPLRIVLQVEPPELARLPWEFLFDSDQDDYLGLAVPVIRSPAVLQPVRPLSLTLPLRILCMAARPGDQYRLAVEEEQLRLQEALAVPEANGLMEIEWAGQTWRDLRNAVKRGPWHIFHFIGHGGFSADGGQGSLAIVADESGGTYSLGGEDLAMLLRNHPSLRLVVLNACDTGRADNLDPFSSLAATLIRRGIPAVVAMQFQISDAAAIEFSRTFYEMIARRLPVDSAVTDARQAIRLALPGTLEWGTPVLYLRSTDGHLFNLAEATPTTRESQPNYTAAVGGEEVGALRPPADISHRAAAAAPAAVGSSHPGLIFNVDREETAGQPPQASSPQGSAPRYHRRRWVLGLSLLVGLIVAAVGTLWVLGGASRPSMGRAIPVGQQPTNIAIAPDGKYAYISNSGANSTGGAVTQIDLATNTPGFAVLVGKVPLRLAITPDSDFAYVPNHGSNSVTPINLATNEADGPSISIVRPRDIAITPDGETAYVASDDGWIYPIHIASNAPDHAIFVSDKCCYSIAIDGAIAYIVDSTTNAVSLLNLTDRRVVDTVTLASPPGMTGFADSIAVGPDGTAYVITTVGNGDGTVTPINPITHMAEPYILVGSWPVAIAIAPDGSTAYVTNSRSNTVTPINLRDKSAETPIRVASDPTDIAISPDGKTAYIVNGGANVVTLIRLHPDSHNK
jgi:YVTN family beta-propeller protein